MADAKPAGSPEASRAFRLNEAAQGHREIVLAWNPRQARIRAAVEKALPVFAECCQVSL